MLNSADIAARIQQRTGRAVTPAGRLSNCVLETDEFRRIRDLPRRDWATLDVEELVPLLTEEYALPPRTCPPTCVCRGEGSMTLRASQAAALREMADCGGLFAPIRVGGGKTLVSLLAGTVCEAKRALLLVPASLIAKTRADAIQLARHWRIRPITIESYEMLSRDRLGRILQGLKPDLVIADEAHRLKNTRAGCTKRLSKYLQQVRKGGEYHCTFVAMSGTITTRSLREYWHLIRWALGNGAPLPGDLEEFQQWCWAIDEKVNPESRWQPGALVRLAEKPEGKDVLERARNAYRQRLIATPGVISTKEEIPGMSLTLKATPLEAPDHLRELVLAMRNSYETPDGHPFEMPMELWRHCREMQCGFYYIWDPRPPDEWLEARKEWSGFLRGVLVRSKNYATPGDIIRAVKDPSTKTDWIREARELHQKWEGVKHSFKPNTVPMWVDDTVLRYAADWLSTGDTDSKLCWVEHRCFGPRLSELTGIPYFGAEGRNSEGTLLENHKGPAICSVHSCSTGLNLQFNWHQNLYVSPMSKNDRWEQSLGRTHRDLQKEDEVTAEVLMMCREAYSSMVYAMRESEYTQHTTGQPQKLVYCTRDLGQIESAIGRRDDEMWKHELEGV